MMKEQDISNGSITADMIREVINQRIIGKNAIRNRDITYKRLADGLTYEEIEAECNISVSQIKRILKKTEPIVFKYL